MDDAAATGAYQPDDNFTISALDTLKVFSDPLRQQIIDALLDGAKTVKQIASELDSIPTKLYYHINLLEEHGLIRVVDTRVVSGIIEKRYGTAARNFSISRTLLTPGLHESDENQGLDAALTAIMEHTRGEIEKHVQGGVIDTSAHAPVHRKLLMMRGRGRLSQAQAEAFYGRLEALIREFEDGHHDSAEHQPENYALVFAIYPTTKTKE
jgi:DNA-binding transcriptional ArsR family regulator